MKKILAFLIVLYSLTPNTIFAKGFDDNWAIGMLDAGVSAYNRDDYYNAYAFFKWCTEHDTHNFLGHCMNNVGHMYFHGKHVTKNYATALKWLEDAKVHGYQDADGIKMIATAKKHVQEKKLADAKRAEERKKAKEKREADAKKAKEKREADAKKAGYTSYAAMQIDIKKKEDAERRRKEEEKKKKTIIQARIDSKDNPGFRDLKPGMLYEDYIEICSSVRCYGIDNIKFSIQTSRESGVILISKIELDMGPITSDGLFLDIVNDLIESDSNIYRKMKRTMDTKYALDFEFSERDRQLFNEKEKRELLVAYSNGQVVLKINRRKKENSYSEDLWLYIEYRDVESGKLFLKRNRPVAANLNDF
jgi:hypothetical protein